MREALLGKLVLILCRATPEELAAIYRFATGEPLGSAECGVRSGECRVRSAEAEMGLRDDETTADGPLTTEHKTTDHGPQDYEGKAGTLTSWNAASKSPYVFRKVGRHWEVIFAGGRAFRLRNTLGVRYLDYLLHAPNEPIRAFDLEVEVQPEKGEARSSNSTQPESDPKAKRDYQQALVRLKADVADAQAVGDREAVESLDTEIEALESALKGGGAADTGERARDNVRKALRVVQEQLKSGGPEEQAFAAHLRTHLSIGFECLYTNPQGRIWG